jgi:hypothetical protein
MKCLNRREWDGKGTGDGSKRTDLLCELGDLSLRRIDESWFRLEVVGERLELDDLVVQDDVGFLDCDPL